MYTENAEKNRLTEAREGSIPWKKWGPYLSERQWGTVREDYSPDGNAWDYFSHDQARSRAYHWGEDGLAGISDDKQKLCFALALWNGKDPILKERLFGLTNSEGNHGEDVKEYYFYLDNTPTHSYMKYLYKYPQEAYPYDLIVKKNKECSRNEMEYELINTGIFDNDRYFDLFVEYAKGGPEEILIRISAHNRGPENATIHLLPTLWFRNVWFDNEKTQKPILQQIDNNTISASSPEISNYKLYCQGAQKLLFTENETNTERFWGQPNITPYVKDAFHEWLIKGKSDAVNPQCIGTKASAYYCLEVAAGSSQEILLRLSSSHIEHPFGEDFNAIFHDRIAEADAFYATITPPSSVSEDEANIMRQALAGMLWSKQYYYFDLEKWLKEHNTHPLMGGNGHSGRNSEWFHMLNDDVISMPDKWEYPWYAAWDLAFHTVALSMVDIDFAKEQLQLMLRNPYFHPNGQIPAYEWNFSDVNPPVHAWAVSIIYRAEKALGREDLDFLRNSFQTLMLNFNWWLNRKDPSGRNVYSGGFLGLDNIGVFDRSAKLPTGGSLEQADGTAWMAFYCQNMLDLALTLAEHDESYEEIAFKFIQHFFWIANAIDRIGIHHDEMWDEKDGFFYDRLRLPNGDAMRLKVRSMVGLLPLCASSVFENLLGKYPHIAEQVEIFKTRYPDLMAHIAPMNASFVGYKSRRLLAILNKEKLQSVLSYMLDENEFLSPYGIRSLSRYHKDHPFVFDVAGEKYSVDYLPAESNSGMFGGNSNWRGPIWMPVNGLLIRALLNLYQFYGEDFKVECPTGSGNAMTLFEVAQELTKRLSNIFLRNANGRRPVYGGTEKFQNDPHWKDHILFYEYFNGDDGAGLGASHQTGWTGIVAYLIGLFGMLDAQEALTITKEELNARMAGKTEVPA